jgi:hypothetical protein
VVKNSLVTFPALLDASWSSVLELKQLQYVDNWLGCNEAAAGMDDAVDDRIGIASGGMVDIAGGSYSPKMRKTMISTATSSF